MSEALKFFFLQLADMYEPHRRLVGSSHHRPNFIHIYSKLEKTALRSILPISSTALFEGLDMLYETYRLKH